MEWWNGLPGGLRGPRTTPRDPRSTCRGWDGRIFKGEALKALWIGLRLRIELEGDVDARRLACFLEMRLPCRPSTGRGFVAVDVELSPGRIRELLKRFLHKSGLRDHRAILDKESCTLRIRKVKGRPKERRESRREGSHAPPPRASLPYFFPG
ncbi:MAG: hypothetical protein QXR65_03905 [Candidatus Bathyarchaeia archaeon]